MPPAINDRQGGKQHAAGNTCDQRHGNALEKRWLFHVRPPLLLLAQKGHFHVLLAHGKIRWQPAFRFVLGHPGPGQQIGLLPHAFQPRPVLPDPLPESGESILQRAAFAAEEFEIALRLQPAADQRACQVVLSGCEADIQFLLDFSERLLHAGLPCDHLSVLVVQHLDALFVAGQVLLHLPYGLPEQHVGFLDAIEDCMKIGPEQP